MTKVLVLLYKRSDLSWEAFGRYWRDAHRPIALRLPGLRRYVENHPPTAGDPPYGVAELYFDSPAAVQTALASAEGQAVLADLANFVDIEQASMTLVAEVLEWRQGGDQDGGMRGEG